MALIRRRPTAPGSADAATVTFRMAVVTTMTVVLAVMAGRVFDRWQPSLLIPPIVVGVVVWATRRLSPRWRLTVLVATLVATTVATSLAVDGTIADAGRAVVNGPRRLLTTEWPSPVEPSVVAAVGALIALSTLVAAVLAARPRWRLAPLVPLAVGAIAVVSLAAPAPPSWPLVVLLGVGALLLGLFPSADPVRARAAALTGDRTFVVTMAAVTVAALGTSVAVAATDRADPRQVEDAELTATLLDPIEATVALRRAAPAIDLFEITDRSTLVGRALPRRWRTAALDAYDGQRWVPRVTLRSIGERLGLTTSLEPGEAPPITFEVEYRTDDVDLVPFPGRPLSIDAPVETDVDRVVVRLASTPAPGTTVTAVSDVAPSAGSIDPATVAVAARPVDELAQIFSDRARNLVDDVEGGNVLEQLRTIDQTMRTEWVLDREAPGGGQQLALLERFVTDTRRGTEEQFVAAFVLLARSLGVDARVALGFEVGPGQLTSPFVIESRHAAAWPEVRLEDGDGETVGWLAFDPVPASEDTAGEEPPTPPEAQSPAAAQPPIQPPADDADDADERTAEPIGNEGRWSTVVTWAVRVGVATTIAVLPILLVVGLILLAKWRRRRSRLRHPDPVRRVRGAWANVTDSLVDAGLTVRPAWTDDRIAVVGAPLAPSVPHELRRLAAMATAVTFGPGQHAALLVDDAAVTSRSVEAALRAGRSRWQRVAWRLSLRSFRRKYRSPVVV